MTELLSILVLVGTGVVAGVFFAVAISVMPALIAMPPDRYVFTHKLLGRHYDRVMPFIVLGSGAIDVVLAAGSNGAVRWVFAVAAVCMVGVAVVSQTRNVPINNQVKKLAPEEVGPDWDDPRFSWRDWHLVRTAFAFAAIALTAAGVVL
ncbi:DUF1772 domain-containing protein [Actinomadura sp. 3N508]|uniref:DUF1772 domain-containing protein n=1 Tax=Actinomadura sp. 3N508 TaxID=3375153 RepID=UPI0037B6CEBD